MLGLYTLLLTFEDLEVPTFQGLLEASTTLNRAASNSNALCLGTLI